MADVGRERVQKVVDRARSAWSGIRARAGEVGGWIKDKLSSAAYFAVGGTEIAAGKVAAAAKAAGEFAADKTVAGVEFVGDKVVAGAEYVDRKYEGAKQSAADARLVAGILASLAGERLSEDWEETKEDAQWVADAAKVLASMGVVTTGYVASEIASFMAEQKNRGVDFLREKGNRAGRAILEVWKKGVEVKNKIGREANRAYRGMRERVSAAVGKFNAWRNRTRMLEARVNAQAEKIQHLERLISMQGVLAEITVVVEEEDDGQATS